MTLGEQIKAKRKALNNLSVPKLARALDIPADRIYKWEKGAKPSDYEDMKKINDFIQNGLEGILNGFAVAEHSHSRNEEALLTLSRIIEKQQETIHYLTTGKPQGTMDEKPKKTA